MDENVVTSVPDPVIVIPTAHIALPDEEIPREKPASFWQMLLPDEARDRVATVVQAGIELDSYGQVVPQLSRRELHTNLQKIAPDIFMIRDRIAQQIQAGKHVVYTPGSYDLVHVGHASYLLECVEAYLQAHEGLTRDDLYVVVLADDDELIGGVKPAHFAAIQGEHPRPIENQRLFGEHIEQLAPGLHPRLVDLVSLPVDLVGFIPAPTEFHKVSNNGGFREWLALASHLECPADAEREVREAISQYDKLLENLRTPSLARIVRAFDHAFCGLSSYDPKTSDWDVASWQLMIHQFIGNVFGVESRERYTRLISLHDVKYKDVVAGIMNPCGIGHQFLDDTEVVSTTKLIETFGWEALVTSKMAAYDKALS